MSQGEKGSVWGQLIGTNDYPVLDSTKRVYRNVTYTGCSEAYKSDLNYVYSNTEIINPIYREHDLIFKNNYNFKEIILRYFFCLNLFKLKLNKVHDY